LLLAAAAVIPACGGGGSGTGDAGAKLPRFVIKGAGGNNIFTNGGSSTVANGGTSGSLLIQGQSGSGVHSLTGLLTIQTSFQVPSAAVNLGTNPLVISASGNLAPPGTSGVVPGTNPGNATGLHITNGATLTIDADNGGGGADAHLTFPNGVLVDSGCAISMGSAAGSNDKVNLHLTASSVVFSAGTTFSSGGNAGGAPVDGGKGGDLKITANGLVALRGDMNLSGGATNAAGNGGKGGDLLVTSTTAVYSTGDILSAGGSALGAGLVGGAGGSVSLGGMLSGVFCSGAISTFGGSGRTGGGAGGSITFAATVADTIVSADLDTTAGTGLTPGAGGGDGGAIALSTNGFNIRVTGNWATHGGTGQAPGGLGGAGGAVTILQQNKNGASIFMPTQIVTGGMGLSVSISTNGGNGAGGGGAGGDVSITQNLDGIDATLAGLNPLYMVGYDSYDTSGMDGAVDGGAAGTVQINNRLFTAGPWNPGSLNPTGPQFNGSTENDVFVNTRGGDGTAGVGGPGGNIQVYGGASATNAVSMGAHGGDGATGASGGGLVVANMDILAGGTPPLPDPGAWVANSGQFLSNGGNGTNGAGGAAGVLELLGHAQVTHAGDFFGGGGNATGASSAGGGVQCIITADGTVTHKGAVISNGGNSVSGTGGNGGTLLVNAQHVTHNGAVTMIGGNGLTGGNGGLGYFNSQAGGTVLHGNFNLTPGTGGTPTVGVLLKDGVDLPLTAGMASY
jgi:hypothetical protein